MAYTDGFETVIGSHYMAMTVFIPDDEIETYLCQKIRQRRDPSSLIPQVKASPLPDHVKENLLLNIEIRRKAALEEDARAASPS